MRNKKFRAIAIKSFALLVVLGTAYQAMAQDAKPTYPSMAPIEQYLMTDRDAEIALARSAAPESISGDAEVLAAKTGTLVPTIERILADLKPEAAYFFADDSGQRSGSIVFDMKDTSLIPAIAEPWCLAFNAKVSLRPVMNPQDLATAGPSITKAAKQYGK